MPAVETVASKQRHHAQASAHVNAKHTATAAKLSLYIQEQLSEPLRENNQQISRIASH